ncbi:helix-turn-helix domain-containing protein [Marinifilum sp.]|uniref:helix-turn-helix domain-containing protein n=1 Tax=Marinifilum sp. TaxID=2033137 RepID=UPI003BAA891A
MESNKQLELAHQFVRNTNATIFLTGKAGTGKTTFLKQLKNELPKRMVVVAPTGVAAINAGGVTIHSFFQLPFGPILPNQILNDKGNSANVKGNTFIKKYRKEKINLIKSLDLLIIDEISMVRADLLDGIDEVLRKFKNQNLPFGGAQVLMIGDLQQLPPVVKHEEWSLLNQHYKTPFFFSSRAFKNSQHVSIELKHVYRQKDQDFIQILNEIRNNHLSSESYQELEKRYLPDFNPSDKDGYITLTTHNARAQKINEEKLDVLEEKPKRFTARIDGQFPEYSYPTDEHLLLKVGAQVMFVKNDSSPKKRYFNGKIGSISQFKEDMITVICQGDDSEIDVTPEEWQNIKYSINDKSKEIEEDVVGQFTQYPLKLAWAITIHKSQGLTFEKAIIDANAAFAHGQVYVALSRCKTLDGVVLKSKLNRSGIICDHAVSSFTQYIEQNPPVEQDLLAAKAHFQHQLLEELFSFKEINKKFAYTNRYLTDNGKSIHGDLAEKMRNADNAVKTELYDVSEKFLPQIQNYCRQTVLEENDNAQNRIKKAAEYFSEKLESLLISILKDYSFDTDNQSIEKTVNKDLKELDEFVSVKYTCLKDCITGFNLTDYLNTRAQAMLQKQTSKTRRKRDVADEKAEHPAMLRTLNNWRKGVAEKNDIPIYFIAAQKSLIDISNKLPYSLEQLNTIHGFGKKKIERYGHEIIELVSEYRQEKGLGLLNFIPEPEEKPKKPSTYEISFELFQEGKNIREIAAFRNLKTTTIESHLAHYVGLGMLDLKDFVETDKIEKIKEQFKISGLETLNPAKEALGDDYSYSELRYVQAFLKNAKE